MALKILLADDSMTAQKSANKILGDAGFQVVTVSNGAAALKKIADVKPDIVVLDIYMPGYSGLEVCEKVKAAAETKDLPVILTVGIMEPFNAADRDRVKADGLIVKPFGDNRENDLLSVIKKIAQKLAGPPPEPDYEKTVKMKAAQFDEDDSYADWKSTADEHAEGEASETGEMPVVAEAEMSAEAAAAPAMMDVEEANHSGTPAFAVEAARSGDTQKIEAVPGKPRVDPALAAFGAAVEQMEVAAHAEPEPPSPPAMMEEEAAPVAEVHIAPPPEHELELTAARQGGDVHVEVAPELEPTISQEDIEVAHGGMDPALVTDAAEMATAFPTRFGVANAEPITVGVAADMPQLYADHAPAVEEPAAEEAAPEPVVEAIPEPVAEVPPVVEEHVEEVAAAPAVEEHAEEAHEVVEAVAHEAVEVEQPPVAMAAAAWLPPVPLAPPPPSWVAQEADLSHEEKHQSLEAEMHRAFADAANAPDMEPEPPPPPPIEPPHEEVSALEAEMAASLGAPPPAPRSAGETYAPAVGIETDATAVVRAVRRALEMLEPELVAQVVRELAKKE